MEKYDLDYWFGHMSDSKSQFDEIADPKTDCVIEQSIDIYADGQKDLLADLHAEQNELM